MKAVNNVLNAINFMEENINRKISSEQIAFSSTYSVYHFSRIFIELTGMSPGEYLRKRRLTLAAQEILFKGRDILETALEYQFMTQEGFTRAFRKYFGITPGRCRRSGMDISKRFTERISIESLYQEKPGTVMEPRIVTLGELKFIGISIFTKDKNKIREAWKMFMRYESKIANYANKKTRYGLGFYTEEFFDNGSFFYMPAARVDSFENIPLEMTAKTLPSSRYAVFTHRGFPEDISITFTSAYGTWLAEANLKKNSCFDFELYDKRFIPGSDISEIDIYIPVE